MRESTARAYLRRQLTAHLNELGYSSSRPRRSLPSVPEIVRVNPVRGRIAYGETVLRSDLELTRCHERLLDFSQRRTRRRSSILLFLGVAAADEEALHALLRELEICNGTRGGHVHVVAIPEAPQRTRRRSSTAISPAEPS